MKQILSFVAFLIFVCVPVQSQESINSYNEGGSSLGGTSPQDNDQEQEKPVKKSVPVKKAPARAQTDDESGPASSTASDDDMYVQGDDYFVMEQPFASQAWAWVSLAKMVTEPSADSKKEGEFMKITDGNNIWTKYYYRTRIMKSGEMKLGAVVFGFNDRVEGDVYNRPENKQEARGGSWWIGKITDTSDMHKGFVTIAGNYKISTNNLRVMQK